ncbi:hypothetical protein Q7C36_016053 [Tachysurus vachellii]|uniref:Uncharacterized protein n=1 Tax=Tachysurus vachellii TaxID=175792 RepID=A0AA88SAI4_TACVA|nr:hypothetical protein Q7C36_016053 [Tachysurus vachellii]
MLWRIDVYQVQNHIVLLYPLCPPPHIGAEGDGQVQPVPVNLPVQLQHQQDEEDQSGETTQRKAINKGILPQGAQDTIKDTHSISSNHSSLK